MSEYEDANKDNLIEALLRELAGYEGKGDEENVRGVKLELDRLGFKAKAPAKRAEKAEAKKETR